MAILGLTACSQEFTETSNTSEQQGEVKIALSAEPRTATQTKATDSDLPDVDDFTVEIFKSDGNKRIYRDTYANTAGTTIPLNTGDFTLSAWHGDSLGVGFDAAYYATTVPFTVEQQVTTQITAVARLENVKVAVVYGSIVSHDYSNFYSVVRSRQSSKYELQFESDETRAGYLPSGNLTYELWAEDEGTWKYYSYDAGYFDPNDFVTFYVDTQHGEGTITLNITIDRSTETIEESIEVPYVTLPKEAPKVTVSGFDATNSIEVIESVALSTDDLKADFVAYGSIAHLYINIDSDYLTNAGIPSQVDLANLDDSTEALLKAQGFTWSPVADHVLCYVDFYGILTKLYNEHYNADNPFKAEISFTVEDSKGQTASTDTYTITNAPSQFTYSINDYDIWAARLTNQTVSCSVGNPEAIAIQYRAEGETEWTTVNSSSVSGTEVSFGTISGLTGGTNYTFRAIYNGDEAGAIAYDITTEEAAQVGNASLDDWQTLTFSFKQDENLFGIRHITSYQDWWRPYLLDEQDPWWDVNSKISMPDDVTYSYNTYKVFPCVGYSVENSTGSGNSAHIIVIDVNNANTDSNYWGSHDIGELFIGTADDDGNHVSDGHAFSSRPSKISFDYDFYSNDSETFFFEVYIYAEDGETVLASYSGSDGGNTRTKPEDKFEDGDTFQWVTYEAEFDYAVTNLKAGKIYISFKASSSSDAAVHGGKDREFAGTTYNVHSGSSLRIDNIQLIYE